jgi:hypothetical protein
MSIVAYFVIKHSENRWHETMHATLSWQTGDAAFTALIEEITASAMKITPSNYIGSRTDAFIASKGSTIVSARPSIGRQMQDAAFRQLPFAEMVVQG